MLALIAAYVQTLPLPDNSFVGYSGIPRISDPDVSIVSHTVTLTLSKDHFDVSSVTLVKNNGRTRSFRVSLPIGNLGGASAPTGLTGTWAGDPVTLYPMNSAGRTAYSGTVEVQSLGSYALRVKYSEPIGRCGSDRMMRLAAYSLLSPTPIGTLMVTFAYGPGVVFHLPDVGPGEGWEVGPKGAFLRRDNYDGKTDLAFCNYYPAGFGRIG